MCLQKKGYDSFEAVEDYHSDGTEGCAVILTAINLETGERSDPEGKTGKGHGHAEIDALYEFLDAIEWDTEKFGKYSLTITCTDKSCCKYCSAVMGLLGIKAGKKTYKSNKKMGVSYSLPPRIREFISEVCKVSERVVEKELQDGW
jgi:hypothetical protein